MNPLHASPEAENESAQWVIPPFWHKLNSFFLFPLQKTPLMYAVVLSLCGYLLLWGMLAAIFVGLGLALAVSRYAFKVAALASIGVTNSEDYRKYGGDDSWTALPWKFFGFLLFYGFIIGKLDGASKGLGALAELAVSFLIPATLMVLISTASLRAALNPFILLGTVSRIGLPYFLLCLFLFLLMQGAPMAIMLLLPLMPKAVLAPLVCFALIYFSWVMAALIGYVMYQHHAELEIEPVKGPDDEAVAKVDPAVAEAKRRDAAVARLVQDSKMQEALETAREWLRTAPDSIADQQRYHRVLKLTDKADELARHAQEFIPLLIRKQRMGEALEAWGSCYKRTPSFKLASADATLALAQTAWKRTQASHTLALLQGFEKNYPGHDATPLAQELVVRALKQGVNKPDQAIRVFMRMKMRYPDHASTQEAAWILRDDLPPAPAASS